MLCAAHSNQIKILNGYLGLLLVANKAISFVHVLRALPSLPPLHHWLTPLSSTAICQSQVHTQSLCLLFLLQLRLNSARKLIKARMKKKRIVARKKILQYVVRQSQSRRTGTTIASACGIFVLSIRRIGAL